jgi:CRP/FNR family cyclic AMP-dependent transcriptional regulator
MRAIQPSSLGLRRIDLLQGLATERLDAISGRCGWRHYEAGQRLIARDAGDRDLHMIVSGSVRVTSYSEGGRETSFRDLAQGSSYGEVAALDGLPRSADVVALTSAVIASLPPGAFRELLREEWIVNERVLLRLSDLVRRLTARVMDLSTHGVQRRIHGELLRLARAGKVEGNSARIDPAPRHADMASLVSTYREQVTRELSALVKAGVLARDGTALVVRDLERLQALAS